METTAALASIQCGFRSPFVGYGLGNVSADVFSGIVRFPQRLRSTFVVSIRAACGGDTIETGKEKRRKEFERNEELIQRVSRSDVIEDDGYSSGDCWTVDVELWETIINRLESMGPSSPETSLNDGRWVKLICGASFEDVADVRNLSLIYTLAGVDCIDCAADSAIVAAVMEGVHAAKDVSQKLSNGVAYLLRKPWVMISINDDEDPHFRKAEFDPQHCPSSCPRPCEIVCPASAIEFQEPNLKASLTQLGNGVIVERCYGCGRCIPICPVGLISAKSYVRPIEAVVNLMRSGVVDAVEIHTCAGHLRAFQDLMPKLGTALTSLKLVAVSVPDLGEVMVPTMSAMFMAMQPFVKNLNLWQLDGRPMSGDIGIGATRAAVALGAQVASSPDRPPGHLQLAGGTNVHTATALKRVGLYGRLTTDKQTGKLEKPMGSSHEKDNGNEVAAIGGVAYGGYARKIVNRFLREMDKLGGANEMDKQRRSQLERYPSLLANAVLEAIILVDSMKRLDC